MQLDYYIVREGKKLRYGYTTGSCAAAAAKAAAAMLLSGKSVSTVCLDTPKGIMLTLEIADIQITKDTVSCSVKKDSGDDPDITNGIMVYASVSRITEGIEIHGGEGVGRVTKPGLDQPVGAAAINSGPRLMIEKACREVCAEYGYSGGLAITISIPRGKELARRTFNPRIGIEGGISVIGTSGIVEPMSNAALVDTIRLELNVLYASGAREVLLIPGNYGENFAETSLRLDVSRHITCSNFIGDAIDAAVLCGFKKILLIGHIGKLVKLGIGMLNTHSSYGDGRMETLAACALENGAEPPVLKEILSCVTTNAAIEKLREHGLLAGTMQTLGRRIEDCLARRVPDGVEIGYVCFTNDDKIKCILAQSGNADELLKIWRTRP